MIWPKSNSVPMTTISACIVGVPPARPLAIKLWHVPNGQLARPDIHQRVAHEAWRLAGRTEHSTILREVQPQIALAAQTPLTAYPPYARICKVFSVSTHHGLLSARHLWPSTRPTGSSMPCSTKSSPTALPAAHASTTTGGFISSRGAVHPRHRA